MIRSYPQLWWFLQILSLLIVGIYCFASIPADLSIYFAAVVVLLVGIPHGAADHRLFSELYANDLDLKAKIKFYAAYLGGIFLVILGWICFPLWTLLLFILGSMYHFGQGNFQYLNRSRLSTFVLIIIWGAWVIVTPVHFHFTEAVPVIEALTKTSLLPGMERNVAFIWYVLCLANMVGILALSSVLSVWECVQEALTLVVLGGLFWQTPLFLGFGLFFSLWHAGPSVVDQIRFFQLRRKNFWWQEYLKCVLPFSVVAIASILLVAYYFGMANITANMWSIIFGGLAALTLPHLLVLDRVYDCLSQQQMVKTHLHG